jgi:hypothetical protein
MAHVVEVSVKQTVVDLDAGSAGSTPSSTACARKRSRRAHASLRYAITPGNMSGYFRGSLLGSPRVHSIAWCVPESCAVSCRA